MIGRTLDIQSVADMPAAIQDDMEIFDEEIFKYVPSYQNGSQTAVIGPPTSGTFVLDQRWKDANISEHRCITAGTPGTWRQQVPAVTNGEPNSGTIPTGYLINDSADSFTLKKHDGGYVWTDVYLVNASGTAGNGIVISGSKIHAIQASNYTANALIFANSTTTLSMSSNLTWNGSTLKVVGTTGTVEVESSTTDAASLLNLWNDSLNGDSAAGNVTFGSSLTNTLASIRGHIGATASDGYITFWTRNSNTVGEKWRITTAGVLQSNGAQTIQTSSGALTINAAGNVKLGNGLEITGTTFSGTGYGITKSSATRLGIVVAGNYSVHFNDTGVIDLVGPTSRTIQADNTLTLGTTANNGNILLSPNGTGFVSSSSVIQINRAAGARLSLVTGGQTWNVDNGTLGYWFAIRDETAGVDRLKILDTSGTVQIPYLTQKSVLFAGASGAVSQDNANFQYDSTNVTGAIGRATTANDTWYIERSGAKTASSSSLTVVNTTTNSTTAGLIRYGMYLSTSGTWTGGGNGIVYGIFIDGATGGNTNWALYNNSGSNVYLGTGNVGIGVTAWGTSAAQVIGIGNGTEPSSSPADMVQLYSVDLSAGNATLGIRTETAVAVDVIGASTHTLSVRINGVTYKILLST